MGVSPRGETDGTTLNEGGFIQNIWGKNLDQGLLIQQQNRFIAENIYIFDIEDTQGHPTHCVYTTGGSLLTHNEDLIFNNLTTWDNAESGAGRAFEFKYVKGLLANNLFASNHAGLIGTRCLESAIITNVNGHDMAETVAVNGLIEIKGNSESKNLLKNIYIENDVDDQKILRMSVVGLGGEDIEVDNLTIYDNTSTNAVMGYIQGTRTKLRNTRIICAGTARKGFVIENAADVEIENSLAKNGAGDYFFEIKATATNTRLTYDESKLIDLVGTTPVLDNGTTSIVINTIYLVGSDTWDPGSIADGDEEQKEVTVTGAVLGDFAIASFSLDVADLVLNAQVTGTDTVTCILANNTGGAIDLAEGTIYVKVIKK